jgi:hypothetical protein
MPDPILALIAEYERLSDIVVPLEEKAEELCRALPSHLRGPAFVRPALGILLYQEEDIETYATSTISRRNGAPRSARI